MTTLLRELKVFQELHQLVLLIYQVTKNVPRSEEFVQFLYISKGSLEEVKYYLLLAYDLQYLPKNDYDNCTMHSDSVGRLLQGLIAYWKSK